MKYISNTGRYDIAFEITKNNRPFKVELIRRRLYLDTGNVATSGITEVDEKDLEELKKQKRFNQMVESGELAILDEKDVKPAEDVKVTQLEEENKKLKEQLKEAEKAPTAKDKKETEKALKAKDDEINSLKAQLEALTAKKDDESADKDKDDEKKDDSEGF